MLSARGIVKRFSGFSLEVPNFSVLPGGCLTVIGPSGAGKTTLLKLLAGLEQPDQGSIVRGGGAVYLSQQPLLLERNVLQNAAFGLVLQKVPKRDALDRVLPLLERVGLGEKLWQPAHKLSGGEQVRLSFVRALSLRPEILLLDEPTASLDPGNVAGLEAFLREANQQGTTLVIVTHNFFQARRLGKRSLFMLGGRLVEEGPTETLFTSPQDARTKAYLSGEMVY